jgi:hypothetical protein
MHLHTHISYISYYNVKSLTLCDKTLFKACTFLNEGRIKLCILLYLLNWQQAHPAYMPCVRLLQLLVNKKQRQLISQ